MTDRPIIFSAPMVKALLAGRKTQTRRILKLPPAPETLGQWEVSKVGGAGITGAGGRPVPEAPCAWHTRTGATVVPRYGAGDRLWVRESAQAVELGDGTDGVRYVADQTFRAIENSADAAEAWGIMHWYSRPAGDDLRREGKQVPSIHMPRWASRLTLIVEDVRIEHLRAISTADVLAEGAPIDPNHHDGTQDGSNPIMCVGDRPCVSQSPHAWYHRLWDSLHGEGAWDANPLVVALTFRVEHGNIDRIGAAA